MIGNGKDQKIEGDGREKEKNWCHSNRSTKPDGGEGGHTGSSDSLRRLGRRGKRKTTNSNACEDVAQTYKAKRVDHQVQRRCNHEEGEIPSGERRVKNTKKRRNNSTGFLQQREESKGKRSDHARRTREAEGP